MNFVTSGAAVMIKNSAFDVSIGCIYLGTKLKYPVEITILSLDSVILKIISAAFSASSILNRPI